jgi:DNA-binding response OmpR family regulator
MLHPAISPQRLLLVDDDLVLLETLKEFLSAEGFQVIPASSGEQAEELIQAATPPSTWC